jgi:predicted Rossmann fold flavoprotein
VIGGGAAGFFAAIQAADQGKNQVSILEKTNKLLSKVKVSGGGRCNVTHDCPYPNKLVQHYPRGGKALRKAFDQFHIKHTIAWFEDRGVKLKVEADGRMFPTTDDSQTIINCLLQEAKKNQIDIQLKCGVERITPKEKGFELKLNNGETRKVDKVILATGGSNKNSNYDWVRELGLKVNSPIPSLFTFNVPNSELKELMGLSVKSGIVQLPGTNWKQEGPILITHWGFSGPGVIKLSAWAAKELFAKSYQFPVLINWTGKTEEEVRTDLQQFRSESPKKQVRSHNLFGIPVRLWEQLCVKAEISVEQKYADLAKKSFNKLIEHLCKDVYAVNGKTTFKEEFVSCGGLILDELNLKTFEVKKHPGLYAVGELTDVDGVTGGFNFQYAWTSGFLAGNDAKRLKT